MTPHARDIPVLSTLYSDAARLLPEKEMPDIRIHQTYLHTRPVARKRLQVQPCHAYTTHIHNTPEGGVSGGAFACPRVTGAE